MLPLVVAGAGALIGGIAKSRAAKARRDAIKAQSGPDLGKIRAELSPWKNKIDNMQSQSTSLMAEAKQMADPRGQYQTQQTQMLTEQLGDQSQQAAQTQSQLMAQRGMGGGGLAGLLQQTNAAQTSEQLRQGMAGIQRQGFAQSQQVRGQGMTLMNQAMNASQKYSENMVRAQEAKRQFQNMKDSASANMRAQQAEGWASAGMGLFKGAMGQVGAGDWTQLGQFLKGEG